MGQHRCDAHRFSSTPSSFKLLPAVLRAGERAEGNYVPSIVIANRVYMKIAAKSPAFARCKVDIKSRKHCAINWQIGIGNGDDVSELAAQQMGFAFIEDYFRRAVSPRDATFGVNDQQCHGQAGEQLI